VFDADSEEELDAVFHALSDRTRRRLIRQLSTGPAVISDLAEPFEMTLAAVSKHLRVLERANLISREIDGRYHRCHISPLPMLSANRWLQEYSAFWEGNLDSLSSFVEQGGLEPKP
jgi:DNA-binding transcriptional ArsR family regulator